MKTRRQCKACPWKTSTRPSQGIPDGYCPAKHANLKRTIATPENKGFVTPFRLMACHESTAPNEQPCVGWLNNQLNQGNNIALRLINRRTTFGELVLDGPQHEYFEDTIK